MDSNEFVSSMKKTSEVVVGDTVRTKVDGIWKTVCRNNIFTDPLLGVVVHGQSREIEVAKPIRWYRGKRV